MFLFVYLNITMFGKINAVYEKFIHVHAMPFNSPSSADESTDIQERDQLRYDRHKERERQRRLAKAHPDKRSKMDRDKDRDVTEKIALGLPSAAGSKEAQFDQRLFNQSKVKLVLYNVCGK